MAGTFSADIQKLYVAYFNRPADPAGLAFWDKVVQAQRGDTCAVSASFAASLEYKASFARMDHAAIVGNIYGNLFGRAAEPAGVAYWTALLGTGKIGIATVVKNIADGAQSSDKTAFANKVLAASAFTAAVDTDAERDAFSGAAVALNTKQFIATINTDASLAAALLPAKLNAAVLKALGAGQAYTLSAALDTAGATGLNDIYSAPLAAGQNTLQDGDVFGNGQGERDVLQAELGNYLNAAVKPDILQIDVVEVRAVDSGSIAASGAPVRVDGGGALSVDAWTSYRSNADLLIENVRIATDKSTRDVTVTMRETDAGNTDFGVYFDRGALRDPGTPNAALRLQALDARNASGSTPLAELPYDGVAFYFNGVLKALRSTAIDAAKTYDELVLALRAAAATTPGLEHIQVVKGAPFEVLDSAGKARAGVELLLTSTRGDVFSVDGVGAGWTLSSGIPHNGIHSNLIAFDNRDAAITSTIVLDGVGRGGIGGDLVVGAMAGDTGAAGVARFNIEVRDNSKLQTINSTSNALREVILTNGLTTSHAEGDPANVLNQGSLSVLGATDPIVAGTVSAPLPGSAAQHNAFGFSDLRLIDAGAMSGKLAFNAEVTAAAIAKYAVAPGADSIRLAYTGGANDDSIAVTLDGGFLASSSNAGRADYTFSADGGAGNDEITIVTADTLSGWYARQHLNANIALNGGAGDDTVRVIGAGDTVIDLGDGNDTVYTAQAAASDNTIIGGAGNDRIVLGMTAGADATASSNDKLVYAGAFGNDVVVGFSGAAGIVAVPGADQLDLSALGGRGAVFAGAAVSNAHQSITLQMETGFNDSAAEIAALYTDGATAVSHVFIAVGSGTVGKVYAISDGAASAVVATLVGTIDLSATGWSSLTAANFS